MIDEAEICAQCEAPGATVQARRAPRHGEFEGTNWDELARIDQLLSAADRENTDVIVESAAWFHEAHLPDNWCAIEGG